MFVCLGICFILCGRSGTSTEFLALTSDSSSSTKLPRRQSLKQCVRWCLPHATPKYVRPYCVHVFVVPVSSTHPRNAPTIHLDTPQMLLSGDPFQLGPSLRSSAASKLGLQTSLLARLLQRLPCVTHRLGAETFVSTWWLTHTYRYITDFVIMDTMEHAIVLQVHEPRRAD